MPAPPKPPTNFHEILKYIWWRLDRAHTLESVRSERRDRGARGGALWHDDAHRSSCVAGGDRRQPVGARRRHRDGRLPRRDVLRSRRAAIGRRKRPKGSPRTSGTSGFASSGPTASSRRWSVRMPASRSTTSRWPAASIWRGGWASACTSTRPRIRSTSTITLANGTASGCSIASSSTACWICPARSSPTARILPMPTSPASTRTQRRSRWPTTRGRT